MSAQPFEADPCNHSTDTDTGALVCIVHTPGPCPNDGPCTYDHEQTPTGHTRLVCTAHPADTCPEPDGLAEAVWDAGYDAQMDQGDES